MPKIDEKMLQIYNRTVSSDSDLGAKVSGVEALALISRAQKLSSKTFGNCFCRPEDRKGSRHLKRLLKQYPTAFSAESRQLILHYVRTGRYNADNQLTIGRTTRSRHLSVRPQTRHTETTHNTNTIVESRHRRRSSETNIEAPSNVTRISSRSVRENGAISRSSRENITNSRTNREHGTNSSSIRTSGTSSRPIRISGTGSRLPRENSISPILNRSNRGEAVTPNVPNASSPSVNEVNRPTGGDRVDGVNGRQILNFVAKKPTWGCHWFPMQETVAGGDPVNNLYGAGGPLDKLDMVSGGHARAYEYEHYRKSIAEGAGFSWWGHCNNAAEAACILKAPKHGVTLMARDGSNVKFTKNDIQGLLVKVVPNLIVKTDFKGERFNSPSRDNPNDPSPDLFIKVVKEWSRDGLPFVLDIDPDMQVWNFPYDQVVITESSQPPEGVSITNLPNDGSVKYYHIEMEGTGFKEKARIYDCYIREGSDGSAIQSAWIKTPYNHRNPDFMWRPHPVGDLMDRSNWKLRGRSSNPEVDPQLVYDIYMQSIA